MDVEIVPRSPALTTAAIASSVPVRVAVIARVVTPSTTVPDVGDSVSVGVGVGVAGAYDIVQVADRAFPSPTST
jgi:hypothetical protein